MKHANILATPDHSDGDMAVEEGREQRRSDRVIVLGDLLYGSERGDLRSWLVAVFLQQLFILGFHIHLVTDQFAR
mgnify:CR=1 FL=1